MVEVNELLDYLECWKTSREIRSHFNLSNSQFFNLIKWCIKADLVEKCSSVGIEPNKTNRSFLYKAIKK